MSDSREKPIVLWCLTDNKPGHRNQLRGLAEALGRRIEIETHFITVPILTTWLQKIGSLLSCLSGRIEVEEKLPIPDWIAACGHSTHFPMLATKKKFGCKSILLMNPSLPASWFDLCFVPEHDEPKNAENIIPTRGVLNPILPSKDDKTDDQKINLVLIGGPSTHHDWIDSEIIQQISEIKEKSSRNLVLTTSRRTPESTTELLQKLASDKLKIVPVEQTDPDWVPDHLAKAEEAFVTEDSVSMIYEAITSGASVTVMNVPRKSGSNPGRVIKGVEQLFVDEFVLQFDDWLVGKKLSSKQLREADRCAEILIERFM